jgi:hypothetical protein
MNEKTIIPRAEWKAWCNRVFAFQLERRMTRWAHTFFPFLFPENQGFSHADAKPVYIYSKRVPHLQKSCGSWEKTME